jgi:hypothetical protein
MKPAEQAPIRTIPIRQSVRRADHATHRFLFADVNRSKLMSAPASRGRHRDSRHDFLPGSFHGEEGHRAAFVYICAGTLICLAAGICAWWPYLIEEHRRLSPWQWIPLWIGDLAAFFWFVSAIISPRIPTRSGARDRGDTPDRKRRRKAFLFSMGAAIAIDLTHSAYAHWREAVDFASAEVVTGDVVANQVWKARDTDRFYLQVRFRDRLNVAHEEEIRVEKVHIGGLPVNAQTALIAGQVAFPVRISFDPSLEARCWLTDVGYDDGDRISLFSYLVLLFQFLGMALFVALLSEQHRLGRDPWWESLYRPLPLIVTAVCFVVFAAPMMWNLRH